MAMSGLRLIAFGCRFLSWSWKLKLGVILGRMGFYLASRDRKRALESLKIAYSTDKTACELRGIGRRSFEHLGKSLVEFLSLSMLDRREKESLFSVEGEEHLLAARDQGKGVVVISGHLGNWEFIPAMLALKNYPIHVVTTPMLDDEMDQWVAHIRSCLLVRIVSSRGGMVSARTAIDVLKRGEILGIMLDQDTNVKSVFVDFFGKKARTPVGAARLALRDGVVTLTCFITRLPDNHHHIVIGPPVRVMRTSDFQKDIETMTAALTARIESHIRRYPDQWVWIHRRWKTAPEKVAA